MITEDGKKALIKVAEWLEAGTPHVDIKGRKLDKFDIKKSVKTFSYFGTTCCIAGAIVQFEGLGTLVNNDRDMGYFGEKGVGNLATEFTGLGKEEALDLFLPFSTDYYSKTCHANFNNPSTAALVIRKGLAVGHFHNAWHDFVGLENVK